MEYERLVHEYSMSIRDVREMAVRERRYWTAMLTWRKETAAWQAMNRDLATGSMSSGGGGGFFRSGRRAVAGTLAAKVTADGVRKLTTDFNGLLEVLKKVRSELEAINRAAAAGGAGGGGVGQGTPTGAAGTQAASGLFGLPGRIAGGPGGPMGVAPVRGPGGFNYGAAAITVAGIARTGLGVIENRFMRNVAQSAPISALDTRTASMYGPQLYQGMEMRRFTFSGEFGGCREAQQQAQQIALGFGTTMAGSQRFLTQAGAMVQASGGSMDIGQAAGQVGLFACTDGRQPCPLAGDHDLPSAG